MDDKIRAIDTVIATLERIKTDGYDNWSRLLGCREVLLKLKAEMENAHENHNQQ